MTNQAQILYKFIVNNGLTHVDIANGYLGHSAISELRKLGLLHITSMDQLPDKTIRYGVVLIHTPIDNLTVCDGARSRWEAENIPL